MQKNLMFVLNAIAIAIAIASASQTTLALRVASFDLPTHTSQTWPWLTNLLLASVLLMLVFLVGSHGFCAVILVWWVVRWHKLLLLCMLPLHIAYDVLASRIV